MRNVKKGTEQNRISSNASYDIHVLNNETLQGFGVKSPQYEWFHYKGWHERNCASAVYFNNQSVLFHHDDKHIKVGKLTFVLSVQAQCSMVECNYLFKIALKGTGGAGKTCFFNRYADGTYTDNWVKNSLGVDFKIRTIEVPELGKVKLQIWDPPSSERFRIITHTYYRGAHGILVLFDCTDRDWSLQHVTQVFNEIEQHAPAGVVKILVATKTDLVNERQVTEQEGKDLAERLCVPYFETSAKLDVNINEAMDMVVNEIVRVGAPEPSPKVPFSLTTTQPAPQSDAKSKVFRCSVM